MLESEGSMRLPSGITDRGEVHINVSEFNIDVQTSRIGLQICRVVLTFLIIGISQYGVGSVQCVRANNSAACPM
jgi:hypothetical protein